MRRRKAYMKYLKMESYEKNGKIKTRVVYTGEYFLLNMPTHLVKRSRIELCIYLILINSFLIVTLFVNSLSGYISYVVLPQVISIAMGVIGGILIFPFLTGRTKYDIKQRNEALIAPKAYYLAKIFLLSITIIARTIFFAVKFGEFDTLIESLFLTGCIVSLALSFREFFIVKKIQFEICPIEKIDEPVDLVKQAVDPDEKIDEPVDLVSQAVDPDEKIVDSVDLVR